MIHTYAFRPSLSSVFVFSRVRALARVSAILATPIVFDVYSNSQCECVLASMMEMEPIISHSYTSHEEKIFLLKHKVKHNTTYP